MLCPLPRLLFPLHLPMKLWVVFQFKCSSAFWASLTSLLLASYSVSFILILQHLEHHRPPRDGRWIDGWVNKWLMMGFLVWCTSRTVKCLLRKEWRAPRWKCGWQVLSKETLGPPLDMGWQKYLLERGLDFGFLMNRSTQLKKKKKTLQKYCRHKTFGEKSAYRVFKGLQIKAATPPL